jgi:tubulin-specific chaperone B
MDLVISTSDISSAKKCVGSQTTVEALKDKLWRKTGTAVASMRLQLRDDTGAKIADLDDDAAPLAAYGPYNGYRIHVLDLDPSSLTSGGWLEDTSLVDKYKMSDEAYDKLHSNFPHANSLLPQQTLFA